MLILYIPLWPTVPNPAPDKSKNKSISPDDLMINNPGEVGLTPASITRTGYSNSTKSKKSGKKSAGREPGGAEKGPGVPPGVDTVIIGKDNEAILPILPALIEKTVGVGIGPLNVILNSVSIPANKSPSIVKLLILKLAQGWGSPWSKISDNDILLIYN